MQQRKKEKQKCSRSGIGKIIRMLTDDVDQYQAAINMANELRVM